MIAVPAVFAQVDHVASGPGFALVVGDVGEAYVPAGVPPGVLAAEHHAAALQLDHRAQGPAVALLHEDRLAPALPLVLAPRHVDGQPAAGLRAAFGLIPAKDQLPGVHERHDQRPLPRSHHGPLRPARILLRLLEQPPLLPAFPPHPRSPTPAPHPPPSLARRPTSRRAPATRTAAPPPSDATAASSRRTAPRSNRAIPRYRLEPATDSMA